MQSINLEMDERKGNESRNVEDKSSVKCDGNGIVLNRETDDEDTEDGEMGFDDGSAQARNNRDPGQPTAHEHQEHMTPHRPYRLWCDFCVMGRGVNSPNRRSDP